MNISMKGRKPLNLYLLNIGPYAGMDPGFCEGICNSYLYTLRLLLLAGTNFSVLVVCCIWQVLILAFF